jgi:S-adenosylmethionine:tRNA ribosyltransferase-isomerase
MDDEWYEIPEDTAEAVNCAKSEGRRIIAVGTTVTRTLEASAFDRPGNIINAGTGKASIFIYPGFRFKIIDALLTNFHLPKSTPMMLTSAFSGLSIVKNTYHEALTRDYRFFSYGDAMLIV